MLSTIAVGTDGSDTAKQAVAEAIELAKRYDAKLVLISAFQDSPGTPKDDPDERQWADSTEAQLQAILSRLEEDLRAEGMACRTLFDEGDPAEVLVRLAEECKADALVIGNKGMRRRILGSVPNSVAHKAPCSVFVVKTT
jgi:nucleotide-binding universal stress UspA family protein